MDKIDIEILACLKENARMKASDISKRINLSVSSGVYSAEVIPLPSKTLLHHGWFEANTIFSTGEQSTLKVLLSLERCISGP